MEIQLHTEIWQEGTMYVAYVPQLDLSSCGHTCEEAKKNIREATEAFVEEAQKMGTLKEILEEAGFALQHDIKVPSSE
jgi:predicted RNase H-like HicB family nuclease